MHKGKRKTDHPTINQIVRLSRLGISQDLAIELTSHQAECAIQDIQRVRANGSADKARKLETAQLAESLAAIENVKVVFISSAPGKPVNRARSVLVAIFG